jgi:putative membrane protein
MARHTATIGRAVRNVALVAVPLLVAATGSVSAQVGGGHGGGMTGGGWGFAGGMGAGGLLWIVLLIGVLALLVYGFAGRSGSRPNGSAAHPSRQPDADRPLSILRDRYARGDISEEEYERRRNYLQRRE